MEIIKCVCEVVLNSLFVSRVFKQKASPGNRHNFYSSGGTQVLVSASNWGPPLVVKTIVKLGVPLIFLVFFSFYQAREAIVLLL